MEVLLAIIVLGIKKIKSNFNRGVIIDTVNLLTRQIMDVEELMQRYEAGERHFVGINLEGEFLSGINLSGANLSRACLRETDLSSAELHGTNLTEADLEKALLDGTELIGANLSRANFKNAYMDADTEWANFSHANLSGIRIHQTSLRDICLVGVNLSHADLFQCGFDGSDLTGADLREAILEQTFFSNANLTNANLKRAKKTDIDDAILCNTIMPDGSICNDGCKSE